MDRNDIPYRKVIPPKSTKQLGQGGPRDMQRRHDMGSASISMPRLDMNALKEIFMNNKEMREDLKSEIRKEMSEVKEVMVSNKSLEGIGLPFEVVEQKIKEAVEYNERQVVSRYESGLCSLNSQLNAAKSHIKDLNGQILEYKQDILNLKKEVSDKNILIEDLRTNGNIEINELKTTILDLITKIKSDKISQSDYTDTGRPVLDEKVFIDPLEVVETDLNSYINIDASGSKEESKRDLKSDIAKLKGLLGSGKYKP